MRNASGDVERLVVFAEDITGRKNAEMGLRLSEGKLRALLEAASEGVSPSTEKARSCL